MSVILYSALSFIVATIFFLIGFFCSIESKCYDIIGGLISYSESNLGILILVWFLLIFSFLIRDPLKKEKKEEKMNQKEEKEIDLKNEYFKDQRPRSRH
ncbi:MAG: hypothetical protein ACD_4C00049G0007 [uncultured bacterium (gcode 4)]|uniref:Uncharacterized protein n=1 Tax=uncultured bacterium (gcode 4) TaxID=1234023 RepID=K2GUU6_9BACT|nr:MAG: hypothetical protein ACD_4C00049G0007 [uncultured bacterium (gcode 4)]